jgi:hypothetical protein
VALAAVDLAKDGSSDPHRRLCFVVFVGFALARSWRFRSAS